MTREELWPIINEMSGKISAIERELEMRAPRHEALEEQMDRVSRQMERVMILGEQALEAIGMLTHGQRALQTALHTHINRSLPRIIRERWDELVPLLIVGMVVLYSNTEIMTRLLLALLGVSPG